MKSQGKISAHKWVRGYLQNFESCELLPLFQYICTDCLDFIR